MSAALERRAAEAFERRFGTPPAAVAFAPGRVNLMGEHTDYNGGCVLPVALELGTAVALGRGDAPGRLDIASDGFADARRRHIAETASGDWSDYALGSLVVAARQTLERDGLRATVASDLPVGAGLSSSAAIEVAAIRAADALQGVARDPVARATLARSVENDFVGLPCGVMDQFASSVGRPGTALFLDTVSLSHRMLPLLPGYSFLVIHSGVGHKLTDDGYARRVEECRAACASLGVGQLCDLDERAMDRIAALPAPLSARARHVVTENARVAHAIAALETGDADAFGALMVASHASQRDDYAVSVPEVDALVAAALQAGATGARLTGGGFGGSVVVLARDDLAGAMTANLIHSLPDARLMATVRPIPQVLNTR
ncbi:galactokinase [Halovulum dunhuangense]|uniref:Galactokinase n=1 Tax=Halovulum dunhuangense TaxID=1505036 RepID=A0A849L5R5_9RHOB|nr:galactokinase [Halovulum dunhuangense]NNU81471.1 galactokinase [Halovulum dunhuangense]